MGKIKFALSFSIMKSVGLANIPMALLLLKEGIGTADKGLPTLEV